MNIITHNKINNDLCGTPVLVEKNKSILEFTTLETMSADESGLVHGGFIFGLADYAAMLAVNHPNVVLGSSDVKFLKPVKVNEKVVATANVEESDGKKRVVFVSVTRNGDAIFKGSFTCFVLPKHVLET